MSELVLTITVPVRVRKVGAEWLATVVPARGIESAGRGATPEAAVEDLQRWMTSLQPKKEANARG